MQSIKEYVNTLKANGLSNSVIKSTRVSLTQLNDFKNLEDCTQEDITGFVVDLLTRYKESTVQIKKMNIKLYYQKQGKPELVDHIKIKKTHHELDINTLLTVKDIDQIIKTTTSLKYKALFAVLWETGGRISEVLNIDKTNDLIENEYGYEVKLYGSKTSHRTGKGYRRMMLIESAPYVRNYLLESSSTDRRLFPLVPESVTYTLKKIGVAIGKPNLYPHLFRHSKATQLVKEGVQESLLRKQFGWTADSEMIAKYIHLNDEDLIQAQLSNAGISQKEIQDSIKLIQPETISTADILKAENKKQSDEIAEMKNELEMLRVFMDTVCKALDVSKPGIGDEIRQIVNS